MDVEAMRDAAKATRAMGLDGAGTVATLIENAAARIAELEREAQSAKERMWETGHALEAAERERDDLRQLAESRLQEASSQQRIAIQRERERDGAVALLREAEAYLSSHQSMNYICTGSRLHNGWIAFLKRFDHD